MIPRLIIVDGFGQTETRDIIQQVVRDVVVEASTNWPVVHHTFKTPGPRSNARDYAVSFFGRMTRFLIQPEGTLIIGNSWLPHGALLGAARWRMLARAGLGLGPVVLHPPGDPTAPVQAALAGFRATTPAPGAQNGSLDPIWGTERTPLVQPAHAPGAGSWCPGQAVLLVGDRPNTAHHGQLKHRLPFFSLHGGGCSAWLAQELEDGGVPESALYWINAYDMTGKPTPDDFLVDLSPRATFALGARAAEWCGALRSGTFQHPSHHMKFHRRKPYMLIHAIRSVLYLPSS